MLLEGGAMKLAWEAMDAAEQRCATADADFLLQATQPAQPPPLQPSQPPVRVPRVHLPLPPYRADPENPPEPRIVSILRMWEHIKDQPYGSIGASSVRYGAPPWRPPPARRPLPMATAKGVPNPELQRLSELAWEKLRGPTAPRFAEPDDDSLFDDDDPEDAFPPLDGSAMTWREYVVAMGLNDGVDELGLKLEDENPPPQPSSAMSMLSSQSEEEATAAMQAGWGHVGAVGAAAAEGSPVDGLLQESGGTILPRLRSDEYLERPAAPMHDEDM